MTASRDIPRAEWLLLASLPMALLGLAYLSSIAINGALYVGPLDRAQAGWAITLPLMLLSPGVAALAARAADNRLSLAVVSIVLTAIFVGAFATWRLTVTTQQIACEAVIHWTQALPPSVLVGVVAAVAFAAASAMAVAVSRRGIPLTLITGGAAGFTGGVAVLAAASIVFPAVSCAPRAI